MEHETYKLPNSCNQNWSCLSYYVSYFYHQGMACLKKYHHFCEKNTLQHPLKVSFAHMSRDNFEKVFRVNFFRVLTGGQNFSVLTYFVGFIDFSFTKFFSPRPQALSINSFYLSVNPCGEFYFVFGSFYTFKIHNQCHVHFSL